MLRLEEVGEEAVVAADRRRVSSVPQGERGEEKRGRPALEALGESRRFGPRQQHAGAANQGLAVATLEREVVGADLEEPAVGAQAGQRKLRQAAGRQADVVPGAAEPRMRAKASMAARERRTWTSSTSTSSPDSCASGSSSAPSSSALSSSGKRSIRRISAAVALGPLGQQRRLAVTGRRDDRDDRAVGSRRRAD